MSPCCHLLPFACFCTPICLSFYAGIPFSLCFFTSLPVFLYPFACLFTDLFLCFLHYFACLFMSSCRSLHPCFGCLFPPSCLPLYFPCHIISPSCLFNPSYLNFLHPLDCLSLHLCTPSSCLSFHFLMSVLLLPLHVFFLLLPAFIFTTLWLSLYSTLPVFLHPLCLSFNASLPIYIPAPFCQCFCTSFHVF